MMKIAHAPEQLYSLGLDLVSALRYMISPLKSAALLHILLPTSQGFENGNHVRTKFADSGISDLVTRLLKRGLHDRE